MKTVLLVTSLLLLSACSSLSVKTDEVPRQKLELELPEPITVLPVEFVVITKENAAEVFAELERKKIQPVLFGLTGLSYKNLSLNIQDIMRFIRLQNEIIKLQKEYYEP